MSGPGLVMVLPDFTILASSFGHYDRRARHFSNEDLKHRPICPVVPAASLCQSNGPMLVADDRRVVIGIRWQLKTTPSRTDFSER
jgi:hypothetical protein